jgi:hypothetical protein
MATTYDKASLVMIPSGVKESKLYSIKPTSGDGDFTFSRGTDTATRVNSSGLIEKERANLLLQSNSFDTTWATTNSSVTSGQSGYDGSSDAWKVDISAGAGKVQQSISTSGVQTISFYAKAGTYNFVRVSVDGGNGIYFNLSSGTKGTIIGSIIDSSIEQVGATDWYRCSMAVSQAITALPIYPAIADNDLTGTSGNIYIQDAQLEQGLVATDYIETTTAAVYEGITDNLPRLDYSGGASCPSLLLEPSRTNLLANSEYFGAWNNTTYPVTITSNSATSPDGNTNATLITPTSGSNRHATRDLNVSAVSGTTYTLSAFFKKAVSRYVVIGDSGDSLWRLVTADLDEGTITNETNATGTIEPYENDWYRVTCTFTRTNAGSVQTFLGAAPTDTNTSAPTFDDTSLTTYVYGAQCEAGNYATSIIPTYGTSASRAADVCNKTSITDLIGQTEGSVFFEFVFNGMSNTNGAIYPLLLSNGSASERFEFVVSSAKALVVYALDNSSIVGEVRTSNSYMVEGTRYKVGVSYSTGGGLNLYINGTLIATDTLPSIPSNNSIYLNDFQTSATYQGLSDYKQVLLFKSALTNAELAALTTI